jgi:hypothetical protein
VWKGTLAFETWIVPHIASFRHLVVVADIAVAGVFAGKEGTSGRSRYRASRVVLCEPHSLGCEAVYVWCVDFVLAIAAKFTVAQIICQNVDYVWPVTLPSPAAVELR